MAEITLIHSSRIRVHSMMLGTSRNAQNDQRMKPGNQNNAPKLCCSTYPSRMQSPTSRVAVTTAHMTDTKNAGPGCCLQELLLLSEIPGKWAHVTTTLTRTASALSSSLHITNVQFNVLGGWVDLMDWALVPRGTPRNIGNIRKVQMLDVWGRY